MNYKTLLPVLALVCITLPSLVLAATSAAPQYVPLVGIPGVEGTQDFGTYVNTLYRLSISVGALLAVLIIIRGGVKYMFSDIVTDKGSAKKEIKGAIFGLLIIISAVLVLSTVNSQTTNLNLSFTTVDKGNKPAVGTNPGSGTGTLSIEQEICAMEGGCSKRPCDDLGDASWELVATGAALGIFIPGVGNLAGAVLGGAAAFSAHLAGNAATCLAVCGWLNGEIINNSITEAGMCVYPNSGISVAENRISEAMDIEEGKCESEGGRFIRGMNPQCLGSINSSSQTYLDQLLETLPESIRQNIDTRIRELVLGNEAVSIINNSDVAGIRNDIGMTEEDKIIFAITPPNNLSEASFIEGQMEGICSDMNAELVVGSINNSRYMICTSTNQQSTHSGSTSNLNYNPSTAYRVNDPADPALGLEAGANHNMEIAFTEPLQYDEGRVRVIVNGQEQWLGCNLISPAICI